MGKLDDRVARLEARPQVERPDAPMTDAERVACIAAVVFRDADGVWRPYPNTERHGVPLAEFFNRVVARLMLERGCSRLELALHLEQQGKASNDK